MTNSRQKGKRGELQWRDFLISHGFTARRGQQFSGDAEAPDVICNELKDKFHPEVKHVENLNIYKAMEQAINDCKDKMPYVAHRKNRKDWLVTMMAEDWIDLIKKYIYKIN